MPKSVKGKNRGQAAFSRGKNRGRKNRGQATLSRLVTWQAIPRVGSRAVLGMAHRPTAAPECQPKNSLSFLPSLSSMEPILPFFFTLAEAPASRSDDRSIFATSNSSLPKMVTVSKCEPKKAHGQRSVGFR